MDLASKDTAVSIVGLPASGKTTFLAALWHLVQRGEIETRLRFGSLSNQDYAYLNSIVKLWRNATEQGRTQLAGTKSVSMNLLDANGRAVRVTFPDVPGEEYRRMWEDRRVDEDLSRILSSGNIMLLINGNKIRAPAWITERAAMAEAIDDPLPDVDPEEWHPRYAPTQVQLVDLMQHFMRPPLSAGPRRLAVMVGAWDKVEGELLLPAAFLAAKLPMFDQYLRSGRDRWVYRIYGVSAQGGEFDENDENNPSPKHRADAERLRDINVASTRIRLIFGDSESHDLTEPLEWLMN
jgi:Double-GTPase 1